MDKRTVLIVDDEFVNLKLLREILKKQYSVRIALNGSEALERAVMEPLPDLILLDIMMPGKDGFTVFRELKSDPLTSSIPVIFITASEGVSIPSGEDIFKGVEFLVKPVNSAALLDIVRDKL